MIFTQVKQRKNINEPQDALEKWLLQHNEKNLVLVLEHPTHISQQGGHYHIIFRSHKCMMIIYKLGKIQSRMRLKL